MIVPQVKFMKEAIRAAEAARDAGDYAIGSVLVSEHGQLVAASGSRSRRDESPISHAESIVILEASKKLKKRHLTGHILYSTHEPCPMCSSLSVWGKVSGIVYGSRIEDMIKYRQEHDVGKYLWRTINIPCKEIIGKSAEDIEVVGDFMRAECTKLFHS